MKTVTLEEYAQAVAALISLAKTGTSGGRAAAQVLLSAYNGGEWQLDITDLCNLDRANYEIALTVIRGRRETGYEPHTLVKDGEHHFHQLWDKWIALNVRERGKEECSQCYGTGKVYLNDDEGDDRTIPCSKCGGKGRYWPSE